MTEKSYVSLGQLRCLACEKDFDDGTVLLDKRLRPVLKPKTVTGMGLCPEHCKEGFITLIEIEDPGESKIRVLPKEAIRTGTVCMVRREAWRLAFNVAAPEKFGPVYVERGVIAKLQAMQGGSR